MPDSNGQMQNISKVVAGKMMAIRYKKILETREEMDEDGNIFESYVFEKERDSEGNASLIDAEFYSYTGSKILIDQAMNDFSHDDLPSPTVIQQFRGKTGQTFFKFT